MNSYYTGLFATVALSACLSFDVAANESIPSIGDGSKDSIVLKQKGVNDKYVRINAISLDFKNPKKDYQEFYVSEGNNVEKSIEEAELKRFKRDLKKEKRELQEGEYEPSEKGASITIDHTVFTSEANKMLKNSGYIDTVNILFSDNNNTHFLEGKIFRISEFYVTRSKKTPTPFFYKYKVTMRWYLKNVYDETIDSTDIVTLSDNLDFALYTARVGSENVISTIQTAVNKSLERVLEDDMIKNNSQLVENLKSTYNDKLVLKGSKSILKKENSQASTVTIITGSGHGSGFAINEEGYIVTNFHVISGEKLDQFDTIKVINSKGEEKIASLVRFNRKVDLALLKVDMKFESPLQLPAAKNFSVLQTVYAIGTPKSRELGQSISIGIISSERKAKSLELIQLSMSVNSGNSGGPVIDDKGALCGVVVSKLFGFGTEGIGFAIPAYKIADYLNISY